MTEEQIRKKIISKNIKNIKSMSGGGVIGEFIDEDINKTYYFHYDYERKEVSLFNSWDEAFEDIMKMNWFEEHIISFFRMIGKKIDDLKYKVKYAYQRLKKGYDDSSIWEINTWFLKIISKMLRELRDKPSVPIIKDLIPNFDPTKKENRYKKLPSKYYKAWNKVLTRMIDCFEGYKDTRDLNINPYNYRTQKEKHYEWEKAQQKRNDALLKEGLGLFVKYFNYLGW